MSTLKVDNIQSKSSAGIKIEGTETVGTDVLFYVSGTTTSKDTSTRGTAMFGGDVVVSGTLYAEKQVIEVVDSTTGSMEIEGTLFVSSSATINGGLIVNDTGGSVDNDFRVESAGEDEALFVDASANTLYINKGETAFTTIIASTNDEAIRVSADGVIFNGDGHATNDFRIESNTKVNAVFVDAGTDQVLILSGGAIGSVNEAAGTDVAFYVSGSRNKRGSDERGTAVFGGDLAVSGALYVDSVLVTGTVVEIDADAITTGKGLQISADALTTGNALYIDDDSANTGTRSTATIIQNNVAATGATALTVQSDANGAVPGIMVDRNFTGTTSIGDLTTDPAGIHIDYDVTGVVASGQIAVIDAFIINYNQDAPTHVGTVLGTGADIRMTGGTSGTQTLKGMAIRTAGSDTGIGLDIDVPDDNDNNWAIICRSQADTGDYFAIQTTTAGATTLSTVDDGGANAHLSLNPDGKVLILSGGAGASNDDSAGNDVAFYVSGSGGLKHTGTRVAALFGGDTVISGSLYALGSSAGLAAAAIGETEGATGLGNDVHLWVSGAIGSKGTGVKGTSAFGGDLTVSGNMHVSEYIYHEGNESAYIRFQANTVSLYGGDGGDKGGFVAAGNDLVYVGSAGTQATKFDQVLILSGGAAASPSESGFTDVAFFVSGAIGSRGTGEKGTALFGGDTAVSGTVHLLDQGSAPSVAAAGEAILYSRGGDLYFKNAGGAETAVGSGTGGVVTSSFTEAAAGELVTTSSVSLAGGKGDGYTADSQGSDTYFFVSGNIGVDSNISVFGGDVFLSGAVEIGAQPGASTNGFQEKFIVNAKDYSELFVVDGDNKKITIGAQGDGGAATPVGNDTFFHVSGAINSKDQGDRHVAVFSGDLVASGNSYFGQDGQPAPDASFFVSGNIGHAKSGDRNCAVIGGDFVVSGNTYFGREATAGYDANFFVSGNIGHRGSGDRATAVFGGDMAVSGSIYALEDVHVDGTTKIVFEDFNNEDQWIASLGSGVTAVAAPTEIDLTAPTVDINASSEVNISNQLTVAGLLEVSEKIGHDGDTDTFIQFDTDQVQIVAGNKYGFKMDENGDPNNVLYLGSAGTEGSRYNKVLILSGGAPASDDGIGLDVSFWVSGSKDHKNFGGGGGVSVIAGDLVVSGTLYGGEDSDAGGTLLNVEAQQVVVTPKQGTENAEPGSDTNFLVSGTIGSRGQDGNKGTSVFSGDLFVSGNTYFGRQPESEQDAFQPSFSVNSANKTDIIHVDGEEDVVVIGAKQQGQDIDIGADTFFHISGSTGHKGEDQRTVTVAGGDLVVSGVLYGGYDGEAETTLLEANAGLVIVSTEQGSQNVEPGADTNFFVSGVIGGRNSGGDRGTSVFGGDVFCSGTLFVGREPQADEDAFTPSLEVNSANQNALFLCDGDEDRVVVGARQQGQSIDIGDDVIFFVSGTKEHKDGSGSGEAAMAVFGGDLVVSGIIHGGYDDEVEGTYLEAQSNQIVFCTADGAENVEPGNDTWFFVSGASGNRGGGDRRTVAFGGDTVISGSLYLLDTETASATSIGVTTGDKVVKVSSDRRLKKDFEPVENALGMVNDLKATYYVPIEKESLLENREIGLISQEVSEVIPELTFSTSKGYGGVHYGNATALLVEAIKELKAEVDVLKARLSDLEN